MPGSRKKAAARLGGRHTPDLPALLRTTVIALSLFVAVMAGVLVVLAWLSAHGWHQAWCPSPSCTT